MNQVDFNIIKYEKVLHQHANGRWSDLQQIRVLLNCLARFTQPAQLGVLLADIVHVENQQLSQRLTAPGIQTQHAVIDGVTFDNLAARLQIVPIISVTHVENTTTIIASIDAESCMQVTDWLSLESALPGFNPEGEFIFGYLVNFDNCKIIVVLSNSPYGPWLDAWIQSPDAGAEPSPPPCCSLTEPIMFQRQHGSVILILQCDD